MMMELNFITDANQMTRLVGKCICAEYHTGFTKHHAERLR